MCRTHVQLLSSNLRSLHRRLRRYRQPFQAQAGLVRPPTDRGSPSLGEGGEGGAQQAGCGIPFVRPCTSMYSYSVGHLVHPTNYRQVYGTTLLTAPNQAGCSTAHRDARKPLAHII